MKSYARTRFENVALVGHGGSGKNHAGRGHSLLDEVDPAAGVASTTIPRNFDFEPEEQKAQDQHLALRATWSGKETRSTFLTRQATGTSWVDTRITLDVPTGRVVVSASDGVQVYTEQTWAMCDELGLPRCVLISSLDRERADFQRTLDDVRETLSTKAVAMQLPIGQEADFVGGWICSP